MALQPLSATVGGVLKNLLVGGDTTNGLAPAHVLVDATGAEKGVGANPVIVSSVGASSIATGQATVDTTSGGKLIVAARPGRKSVLIVQEGATLVRLGPPGVTASTGIPLPGVQYATVTLEGGAAVYGTVASGTQLVSFLEQF